MLCCLRFLYGGTNSSANVAMKMNQNNIQLDTANMGKILKFTSKQYGICERAIECHFNAVVRINKGLFCVFFSLDRS